MTTKYNLKLKYNLNRGILLDRLWRALGLLVLDGMAGLAQPVIQHALKCFHFKVWAQA